MKNNIQGWSFDRAFSADGTSTLDSLTIEKRKFEARLVAIPILQAQLTHSLKITDKDIVWLEQLNRRKIKKWERENGKSVKDAVYYGKKKLVTLKGQITSLEEEKKRIPSKIKSIQQQLNTLIKGESTGLEKGVDKETAKELGEIELQKEKERLAHERALREAELKAESEKRELEAQKDKQQLEAQTKTDQETEVNKTKIYIGIGITLLVIITGVIIYKRKMVKVKG